jgi:hypothetical protein
MVAAGALIIASWPSFPLVLTALVLQAITGGFLGLAVAAISLGLVGHAALGERLGRNQRFASTGGVLAAGLMGLIGYFLSYRAIFLVAAALVLPLLFALGRIQPSDIHFGRACGVPDHHGASAPPRTRRRSVWMDRGLLTFAGCVFLFQMANASMLPLAGESLVYSEVPFSSLIVSALIIVPQVIVALMAPWAGRRSKTWGRRPLLLVGFAALPLRALLFAWTANPIILIAAQVLDGVSGTMLGVLTAHGFAPDQAWLDHVRLSSVRLARGCSASFVSPLGLVQTNHHCARDCIAQLSTRTDDLVEAGFYAKTAQDERKCPDVEVNQLTAISDVTARVNAATAGRDGEARIDAKRAVEATIARECSAAQFVAGCSVSGNREWLLQTTQEPLGDYRRRNLKKD